MLIMNNVYVRCFVICAIAGLTAVSGDLEKSDVDWSTAVRTVLAMFIALRAFMDQSLSKDPTITTITVDPVTVPATITTTPSESNTTTPIREGDANVGN